MGEHATVLLPGTESAGGALWVLVDDGAGFDAVLDALVADGLSSLPGFLLLGTEGQTTRVVIRGDAEATFEATEGTVHVAGSGGSMWVERVLHEVSHLSVTLPDELASGPGLTVIAGLVRLGSLESPTRTAPPAPLPAAPPPPPPPTPRLELVRDPLTDGIDLPADEDAAPTDENVLDEPPAWTPPTAVPPPPPVVPILPPPPTIPPPPTPPAWADEVTEQIPATPPAPEPAAEAEPGLESESERSWERPGPVAPCRSPAAPRSTWSASS